jgi:NADPH:quinone reductase-like Zn-dependent oxidoreductase
MLTSSISWATRDTEDTSGLQELALVGAAPYLTAKLPSNISFDEAATLPTSLNTSSVALNHSDGHGIPSPFQGNRDFGKGKAALVLGGSGVVGLGGKISRSTLY